MLSTAPAAGTASTAPAFLRRRFRDVPRRAQSGAARPARAPATLNPKPFISRFRDVPSGLLDFISGLGVIPLPLP